MNEGRDELTSGSKDSEQPQSVPIVPIAGVSEPTPVVPIAGTTSNDGSTGSVPVEMPDFSSITASVFVSPPPPNELLGEGEEPASSIPGKIFQSVKSIAANYVSDTLDKRADRHFTQPLTDIYVDVPDDRYRAFGEELEAIPTDSNQQENASDADMFVTHKHIFEAYKRLAEEFLPVQQISGSLIGIIGLATVCSVVANWYIVKLSGDYALDVGKKFGLDGG